MQMKAQVKVKGPVMDGRGPEIVQKGLDNVMMEAVALLEREVKELTPVGAFGAQGGLLGSIAGEVKGRGTTMIKGVVMSAHKYTEAVEKGTRPHMPPADPIQLWVQRKLHIEDGKESRQVAFKIARYISKHGTKGQHMFEKGLKKSWPGLKHMFDKAGYTITRRLDG